jgi:hypothetical protein
MNKETIFEKGILAKKIKEHFTKYPSATSVIVKSKQNDGKKYWKVTKEGKNFKIVEIKTIKEEYVLEMDVPKPKKKLNEVSSQFATISKVFSDAIVTMDHTKLSNALRQIQPLMGQLSDPKEKEQAGAINGTLTMAVNSTTKQGSTVQVPIQRTAPTQLTTGKSNKGKSIKEADEAPKKKDPEEPSSINPPEEDDGLETVDGEDVSNPEEVTPEKSEELTLFDETLKGQTIKASDLQLDVNGGVLSLQLVSSSAPFELEWHNDGKVLFRNKGRPYILKNTKNITKGDK